MLNHSSLWLLLRIRGEQVFVQAFTVTDRENVCIYKTIALMSMRSIVKGHGGLKMAVRTAREVRRMFCHSDRCILLPRWDGLQPIGQMAVVEHKYRKHGLFHSSRQKSQFRPVSNTPRQVFLPSDEEYTHTNSWKVVAVSLAGHLFILQSS